METRWNSTSDRIVRHFLALLCNLNVLNKQVSSVYHHWILAFSFQKEIELKVSTENLRSMADTSPINETPAKGTSAQAPGAAKRRQGGRGGRSSSPPRQMLSILRSPSSPALQKTFHAPKSNQIYTVSTARTFNPERIDALIATLAEKLVCLLALVLISVSNLSIVAIPLLYTRIAMHILLIWVIKQRSSMAQRNQLWEPVILRVRLSR